MKKNLLLVMALSVMGCREETADTEPPVRGLKVHAVAAVEPTSLRRFPAVLEASRITTLSFEVAGKLQEVTLDVGQRVQEGETLASLDPASLQLQVDNATAALTEARAAARYARENAARQQELFERGSVTKVVADDARTQQEIAQATVDQAQSALDTALENFNKTSIRAPFDGIINSVEVQSFATVAAGTPVAQLYPSDSFEVAFSVNFDTVNRLVVGKPATVRLADKPDVVLDAVVSEIGARADAVSSFPIVLKLRETYPLLKAGMAVEVAMEFELPAEEGFAIPLSTLVNDGKSRGATKPGEPSVAGVYVFDPQSSTVQRRDITVSAIRGNQLIVTDGLVVGEKVASAGVSFLREGQKVKLLDGEG
jgi:RND family efflux transporter MFP subunit